MVKSFLGHKHQTRTPFQRHQPFNYPANRLIIRLTMIQWDKLSSEEKAFGGLKVQLIYCP